MECGQSKKVLAVSGDYSSLQRILKEAFDREIIIPPSGITLIAA